jgi:positive regulator of sigma E activity
LAARLRKKSAWRMPLHAGVRAGDVWRVGMDHAAMLRGAVRVYVLPLAGLLTGAMLGNTVGGDAGAVTGGLLGMALCLVCSWRFPPSRNVSLVFIEKIHSA